MNRAQFLLRILILAHVQVLATGLQAQTATPSVDPAISEIATRIARSLQEKHAKKIIVADLRGPEGQSNPIGKWLADELSESLSRNFPALEVIARPADQASSGHDHAEDSLASAQQSVKNWAHRLGANVVIMGTFAKTSDGLAISLEAERCTGSELFLGVVTGIVPVTNDITSLSNKPIPELRTGIHRAGVAGFGIPACIYCPPPQITREARQAKSQGPVVLEVTITTDGRATNISVKKSPGKALETAALDAVGKWRFKPAIGPDGRPAAVICPIEITFRF
ncbi:MAG: energy transducer TonB [Candidatus Acidiferrum sp.]